MRASPTRRQVLGGLGATVVGSAVVGGAATQIRIDPIVTWKPAPGTWPYNRYDSGQTAANPHASPPEAPEIVWQTTIPGDGISFVVGSDRVYAAGVTLNDSGETLTALNRRDGTPHWRQTARSVYTHALHYGTLYTIIEEVLTALDAETGQSHWRAAHSSARGRGSLLVTADTIFVGKVAYDIQDGSYIWSSSNDLVQRFVAQNGSLFGVTPDKSVIKYRPRSVFEVALGMDPTNAWKIVMEGTGAIVRDGLLFRWRGHGQEGQPALAAFDTESGERVWSTLVPTDFASVADGAVGEASEYKVNVRRSAITKSRGFVGAEARARNWPEPIHAVFGFSTNDGSILWQHSLDQSLDVLHDIAVANDTVLLAHGGGEFKPDTAAVQALDGATGREQWRVSTEYQPVQIAAVDKTIFVATAPKPNEEPNEVPNRVIALR